MKTLIVLILVSVTLPACAILDSGPAVVTVETNRTSYAAGDEMWVAIKNNRAEPVLRHYICEPGVSPLKQLVGTDWRDHDPPQGCFLGYTPPDTILTRQSLLEKLTAPADEGTFRWAFHITRKDGSLLPEAERWSNAFAVVAAE